MDPVETSQVFEEDPNLQLTEQADGSVFVELPPEEEVEESHHDDNLAETLDKFVLNTLSSDLLELVEKDKKAREKRDEQYEEGLRRTGLGDDAPGGAKFQGASKAVHPILAEGCVDFAARAIKELFPANGPVKTKIVGEADRDKLEKAQKKRDYLNFLLTKRMPSYRDEKEVMLTQLPLGGSQYEKYSVEGEEGKYRYSMQFVPVDKVLLPFSVSSFCSSPRVTEMLDVTQSQFEQRVESGFYRDIRITREQLPEETRAEKANDRIEGRESDAYNEDGLRLVYEIKCFRAIEDDDPKEYVVHIDASTREVLAVYRNWEEGKDPKEAVPWMVENKFIPWRGAYGIGLPHLIGSLSGALTGALRALLDSAHINNSPGAVKLKGGRGSGQNITIEQTQVQEIEAPANTDDIRKVIMPLPFNQPSAVLMQLLDWITAQAKGVVATAEEKIADASNQMPVGTAMALIEQGSQVFSSIHARLHESQRRGLAILCRLVRTYPNLEDLQRFDLTPEDFEDSDDIQPVSDPSIFSEAQRYAQLQEQLKVMATLPQLPWNQDEFARRALELLRTEGIESLLPKKPEPVTADPVTENYKAVTEGAPLKASEEQDHVAHIQEHLRFVTDPMFGAGPTIAGPQLQGILAHCQQHLMFVYMGISATAAAIHTAQTGEEGDMAIAKATQFAAEQFAQLAQQLNPAFEEAAQIVQSKMPQPPGDPAVEKTFEAAMAEIERKKQADKQAHDLALQKHNDEQELAAAERAAEERNLEFEKRMECFREVVNLQIADIQETGKQQLEELRQRVELMKNDADNAAHSETELEKNLQDNQTAIIVAEMKEQMQLQQQTLAAIEQAIAKMFGTSTEQ